MSQIIFTESLYKTFYLKINYKFDLIVLLRFISTYYFKKFPCLR